LKPDPDETVARDRHRELIGASRRIDDVEQRDLGCRRGGPRRDEHGRANV